MPYKKYPLLSKKKLKSGDAPLTESLIHNDTFAHPFQSGSDFSSFLESLPNINAASDFKQFVQNLRNARQKEKPIILGLGSSVAQLGLNPIIIDLMERGWVSAIAVESAFMINDFEIALSGKIAPYTPNKPIQFSYFNKDETGLFLNVALKDGYDQNLGAGEAVGHYLISSSFSFNHFSIFYKAYKLNIPVTVHPAIGMDFIHYHPKFDGAIAGALTETDFMLFSSVISMIGNGGIYINIQSPYILPGIFLNALSFCNGVDKEVKQFHTGIFKDGNCSHQMEYNIIDRSIMAGGRGYKFEGSPEILFPMLAAALLNTGNS